MRFPKTCRLSQPCFCGGNSYCSFTFVLWLWLTVCSFSLSTCFNFIGGDFVKYGGEVTKTTFCPDLKRQCPEAGKFVKLRMATGGFRVAEGVFIAAGLMNLNPNLIFLAAVLEICETVVGIIYGSYTNSNADAICEGVMVEAFKDGNFNSICRYALYPRDLGVCVDECAEHYAYICHQYVLMAFVSVYIIVVMYSYICQECESDHTEVYYPRMSTGSLRQRYDVHE